MPANKNGSQPKDDPPAEGYLLSQLPCRFICIVYEERQSWVTGHT